MGETSKKSLGDFMQFIPTYLQQASSGGQEFGMHLSHTALWSRFVGWQAATSARRAMVACSPAAGVPALRVVALLLPA